MSTGTTLYRAFDADGRLLYVGVSWNAFHRLAQHRHKAGWWDGAARVDLERFASRNEAEIAELRAIRFEFPAFNILGKRTAPQPVRKVTRKVGAIVALTDSLPQYLGNHEIAAMLGVSRQRVNQLAKMNDFPAPVAEFAAGRLWSLDDVKAWARATGRL